MSIAACGPRCYAIELGVGDCYAVGGRATGDEHLATNEGDFDVVNPAGGTNSQCLYSMQLNGLFLHKIGSGKGDSITSPNILRIELGNVDVSANS